MIYYNDGIPQELRDCTEQAVQEYVKFINQIPFAFPYPILDSFPDIWIEPLVLKQGKEAIADKITNQAEVKYERSLDKLILSIPENELTPQHRYFHEFTHIIDANYYERSKNKTPEGLLCYTEYHASQIELLSLIGVESVRNRFPYNKMITIGSTNKAIQVSVLQYWNHFIQEDAVELVKNSRYLATLFPLFYYWGYRSVFDMYSDVNANPENIYSALSKHQLIMNALSPHFNQELGSLERIMKGWLDDKKTEEAIELCDKMLLLADVPDDNFL